VANGWVNLAVQNDSQWERFCRLVLGQSDLSADRRFASNELRVRDRATLEPLIDEILARLSRSEVLRRLEAADVPYGALNNLGDLVAHPQLAARDRWLDVASPAGPLRALKHPLNVSGMPRREGAVPALGEHTEDVRRELAQVSEEG
jgi:crotonobetainyl-CoA:carnitine CoA-transferase CaiB-like acyl-CoA transferase